jgi:hypothetical protein
MSRDVAPVNGSTTGPIYTDPYDVAAASKNYRTQREARERQQEQGVLSQVQGIRLNQENSNHWWIFRPSIGSYTQGAVYPEGHPKQGQPIMRKNADGQDEQVMEVTPRKKRSWGDFWSSVGTSLLNVGKGVLNSVKEVGKSLFCSSDGSFSPLKTLAIVGCVALCCTGVGAAIAGPALTAMATNALVVVTAVSVAKGAIKTVVKAGQWCQDMANGNYESAEQKAFEGGDSLGETAMDALAMSKLKFVSMATRTEGAVNNAGRLARLTEMCGQWRQTLASFSGKSVPAVARDLWTAFRNTAQPGTTANESAGFWRTTRSVAATTIKGSPSVLSRNVALLNMDRQSVEDNLKPDQESLSLTMPTTSPALQSGTPDATTTPTDYPGRTAFSV